MTATDNRLQVRVTGELREWLTLRAGSEGSSDSPDRRARQELMRLQAILRGELRRQHWTAGELHALMYVLGDYSPGEWLWEIGIGFLQAIFTERAEEDEAFPLRNPQALEALLAKVRGLGPGASAALLDGLYRWRAADLPATPEGFSDAGFRCSS